MDRNSVMTDQVLLNIVNDKLDDIEKKIDVTRDDIKDIAKETRQAVTHLASDHKITHEKVIKLETQINIMNKFIAVLGTGFIGLVGKVIWDVIIKRGP